MDSCAQIFIHPTRESIFSLAAGPWRVVNNEQGQWFADSGGTKATTLAYDFKRNLYFANGQNASAPSTIGDLTALVANPLFTNAVGADFTIQSTSPARAAATQALPTGFVVSDDIRGFVRGTGASVLGSYDTR